MAKRGSSLYGVELRPIEGLEGYYSVTRDGRIFSHFSADFIKTSFNWVGYEQIPLNRPGDKRKLVYVHRAVAQAYIDNPENKKEVDHIDDDKKNNSVENLEWVTRSENIQRAYDSGAIPRYKDRSPNGVRKEGRVYKPGTNKYYVTRKAVGIDT